jgi:hypothetical protein
MSLVNSFSSDEGRRKKGWGGELDVRITRKCARAPSTGYIFPFHQIWWWNAGFYLVHLHLLICAEYLFVPQSYIRASHWQYVRQQIMAFSLVFGVWRNHWSLRMRVDLLISFLFLYILWLWSLWPKHTKADRVGERGMVERGEKGEWRVVTFGIDHRQLMNACNKTEMPLCQGKGRWLSNNPSPEHSIVSTQLSLSSPSPAMSWFRLTKRHNDVLWRQVTQDII